MCECNVQNPYIKLRDALIDLLDINIPKFQQIWDEIGYNKTEIEFRCSNVQLNIEGLFKCLLKEAGVEQEGYQEIVQNLLAEASELEKELGVQYGETFHRNKLKFAASSLQANIEVYREVKEERLDRLAKCRLKEAGLCKALEITPKPDFTNVVPSSRDLDEFETYLVQMEEEKERLMSDYRKTKIAIVTLARELGITASVNFHDLILYEDDSKFKASKQRMAYLKDYHQMLENQLEEAKIMELKLRQELSLLWEHLGLDVQYREWFLATYQGHSASTIQELKEEVKRCRRLKCQKIESSVGEIRRELADWWEKCFVSVEERNKFTPYQSTLYTEDLLEQHNLKVQLFKSYYEDNKDIFQLVMKRQKLWDKMLDLEGRAKDPERRFKNRGGQLLHEERERKNIQKELSKVEHELLNHLEHYEVIHETPFYINGEILKQKIKCQWAHHKALKESEKPTRRLGLRSNSQYHVWTSGKKHHGNGGSSSKQHNSEPRPNKNRAGNGSNMG